MADSSVSQFPSLLEGTFDVQGKKCTVTLTSESLRWHQITGKGKDEVVIPVGEILAVTTTTEKVKAAGDCFLQLAYIAHKKKYHLGKTTAKLCGSLEVGTKWSQSIQECINGVSARPRNALVLINPISGSRKGPKQYQEKVAPVFSEADVKTQVIITESADHVKEIIDRHDLAAIDSLVVVGGDGMYHLVVDALMQRLVREAGLDINDTEIDIPEASLPIGIIPCGIGNGTANGCYGCYDVLTAALAIVRGGRQMVNLHSLWSGGEFMVYSSLLQGAGVMADLIYDTAARRSMGIWRYPVVIGSYLTKSSVRTLDLTIEYKPPVLPPPKSDTAEDAPVSQGASQSLNIYSQPWQTYQGQCALLATFLSDIIGLRETRNLAHMDFSRLFLQKQWGRWTYFKFFMYLMKVDPALLHHDKFDNMAFVEYKVKLNNPEEQGSHANLLNIDGETFRLNKPEYHVKLFPRKISLFASVSQDFFLDNNL